MGAGKSTLGPRLADRLGRTFVAVDAIVEERVGRSIAEIFELDGEAAFRELEADSCATSCGGATAVVESRRRRRRGDAAALAESTRSRSTST